MFDALLKGAAPDEPREETNTENLSSHCSIQQGGVASRPGHEYDAFLSRELGREIFNFGFAGNGVEELSVAQVRRGAVPYPFYVGLGRERH